MNAPGLGPDRIRSRSRGGTLLVAGVLFAGLTVTSNAPAAQAYNKIYLLNPSGDGHTNVISAKDDGSYHLMAWTASYPPNAHAAFHYEIDSGDGQPPVIGDPIPGVDVSIEQHPDGIMYQGEWSIHDGLPEFDGRASLVSIVVVLYSGDTEVARDTEIVQMNNASRDSNHPDDAQDRAETASITDPISGARMRFFTMEGGHSRGFVTGSTSSGTTSVAAHYSMSPLGENPIWNDCGADLEVARDFALTCALAEGDGVSDVTAIGVTATGTDPGSGDVAVPLPYAETLFRGLSHGPLKGASLTVVPNGRSDALRVDGIGSYGDDGVAVSLGEGASSWSAKWKRIADSEARGELTTGAYESLGSSGSQRLSEISFVDEGKSLRVTAAFAGEEPGAGQRICLWRDSDPKEPYELICLRGTIKPRRSRGAAIITSSSNKKTPPSMKLGPTEVLLGNDGLLRYSFARRTVFGIGKRRIAADGISFAPVDRALRESLRSAVFTDVFLYGNGFTELVITDESVSR